MSTASEEINLEFEWQKQWSIVCESFAKTTNREKRLDTDIHSATPEKIARILWDQAKDPDDGQEHDWKKVGDLALKVGKTLVAMSGPIVQVASMVFGPSQIAMNAFSFLVEAACAYHKMFEDLKKLFGKLSIALERFDTYRRNQDVLNFRVKQRANEILLKFVDICELGYRLIHGSLKNRLKVMVKSVLFKDDQGIGDKLASLEESAQVETQQNIIEILALSGAGAGKMTEIREGQKRAETVAENDKQLSWLKEKLGDENQYEVWRRHMLTAELLAGSGTWLQETEAFQLWCKPDQSNRSILLFDGVMGSGKTILVSTVVDYIQKSMSRKTGADEVAFPAYYYFNKRQTVDAALRAMAMLLVMLDELYRKELYARLDKQFKTATLPTNPKELFGLLFDGKSSGNIILLFDDIHAAENPNLIEDLCQIVTQDQSRYKRIKILVSGRLSMSKLLSNLTSSENCIDMTSQNKDIKTFVQLKVDQLPFLKASAPAILELKQQVCETLGKCKSFSEILILLSEIADQTRAIGIRDVLSKADLGADAAIDRLLTKANNLCNDDINDLNVLLRWTLCSEHEPTDLPVTLSDLDLVLELYNNEPSLKSLRERIEDEFRGFFKINSDSSISFTSTSVRDYFARKVDQIENSSEQADILRTEGEAKILRFQLKTMCDSDTYHKFGFDSILTNISRRTSKVHVDTTQMFAQVALDCLRLTKATSLLDSVNSQSMHGKAALIWSFRLGDADIGLVKNELKAELGCRLVPMLSEDTKIECWQPLSYPGYILFCQQEIQDCLLDWIKDPVVRAALPEPSKQWVSAVLSSSETPKKALWFNVAKFKAKQWLIFEADMASAMSMSEMTFATKSMLMKPEIRRDSFRFIRGFLKSLDDPEYSIGSYLSVRILEEEIDTISQWVKVSLGIEKWSSTALCRLADTYRFYGWLEKAAKLYRSAVNTDPESVEALVSCAEALFALGQKQRAIGFLHSAIQKLENRIPVDIEKAVAHIYTLTNWHISLEQFEEAQAIIEQRYYEAGYQETLFPLLFEVYARQSNFEQSRMLLDDVLRESIDPENVDESRCRFWLPLLKEDDNDVLNKILLIAEKIGYSGRISKELQSVLESFDAVMKNHQGPKDMAYCHMVVSRIELCLSLLAWSQRYPPGEHELLTLLKLCEPSLVVDTLPFPGVFQKHIASIKQTLIMQICFHHLRRAMRADLHSAEEKNWISKVENLCLQVNGSAQPENQISSDILLGSYYGCRGDIETATALLRSQAELALSLLSDDDASNDWIAYTLLGDISLKAGDDTNALLGYLLYNSTNVSNSAAAPSTSSTSSDSKTISDEFDVENETPTEESQLDFEGELDDSGAISNQQSAAKILTCGGKCDKSWSAIGDFYACRLCDDLALCKECLDKMMAGTILLKTCNFKHHFLYIPPWNPEKAVDLESGKIEVDGQSLTIEEWKERIRKIWDLPEDED